MNEVLFALSNRPLVYCLHVDQDPSSLRRTASISVWDNGRAFLLKFANPRPLAALTAVFDCIEMRVLGLETANSFDGESARYKLEFCALDELPSVVIVDDFDYETRYPVARGG